jgi:excisionase family DNA binding protein
MDTADAPRLTTGDVARRLLVNPRTVRRLEKQGLLPAFRLTPKSPRRFRTSDVEEFLARAERGGS